MMCIERHNFPVFFPKIYSDFARLFTARFSCSPTYHQVGAVIIKKAESVDSITETGVNMV